MYFNQRFGVSAIKMRALGVFNPEIGVDNKVFVDPKLLVDATDEFKGTHADLLNYFAGVVTLIKQIKKEADSDIAWVAAWNRMCFKETSNTGIGLSKEGTRGNGIGEKLAKKIIARAIQILPAVGYEPDLFELIGVFADGIGCDRLSDMIVSILKAQFIAYTDRITRTLSISRTYTIRVAQKDFLLPQFERGDDPIILLPQQLLRPLPIAADIQEALENADLNDEARRQVNKMFADAYEHGGAPGKTTLRNFLLSRRSLFDGVLSGYRKAKSSQYDFDTDPLRIAGYEAIAYELVGKPKIDISGLTEWQRIAGCVKETLDHVKRNIEENRLSEVLYDNNGKPRNEVISQRIIYSIATIFAKIYNVDVSEQGNAGPGAVDFRFTVGFKHRLLVELKLSTHQRLKEGYYEQLPTYAKAEGIKKMILIVIRVTPNDANIDRLKQAIALRSLPIQVIVIDAVPKPSASRRKIDN